VKLIEFAVEMLIKVASVINPMSMLDEVRRT